MNLSILLKIIIIKRYLLFYVLIQIYLIPRDATVLMVV